MPILGEPREVYDVYVVRCACCETFPVQSLVMKGQAARLPEPERAKAIIECILSEGNASSGDLAWLEENWKGAAEAAREWFGRTNHGLQAQV